MVEIIDYTSHIADISSICPERCNCFTNLLDEFVSNGVMNKYIVRCNADLSSIRKSPHYDFLGSQFNVCTRIDNRRALSSKL